VDHAHFLHRCLALAERGRETVGINPMVGAVLVREGAITAEAFHERFGGPHAEALLIKSFEQIFRPDDVLYVNVEPCCHRDKKTLPCTSAIIEAGIRCVVVGMRDPNPAVAGKGILELQTHGIEVVGPVERARSEWLNRGFVSLMTKERPWVTLHRAQTADSRIANPDGSPLKITGEEQDEWCHRRLRATHDAILVGVGTILTDDPLLTVRHMPSTRFQPLRIVLDPRFRIPLRARVLEGVSAQKAIVCVQETDEAEMTEETKEKYAELLRRGVRVLQLPFTAEGCFDWRSLWKALTTPTTDFFGIASVLVEGGSRTWEHFRRSGMVDCEVTLVGRGP
jgi:diaminohydroxyphosphoribosylaminopyrimidine deaminase / 5-amino-6-(5-phosphoribosylamino)uracil reductase